MDHLQGALLGVRVGEMFHGVLTVEHPGPMCCGDQALWGQKTQTLEGLPRGARIKLSDPP